MNEPQDDLSVEELRRLLVEKRRSARQERLERYRRTGRIVTLVPDADSAALESLRSHNLDDQRQAGRARRAGGAGRFFDAFLLIVEVGAVVGLVFVLMSALQVLQDWNQQSAEVLTLPTMTPTPLIAAIVLPSGHTPPNSAGGAQYNDAEIPVHLRPLVQSLASVPIPTPGPEQAVRVQIPDIDVYATIVQGDGWEQLKKGVGQHIGSADPGEKGNHVLTAHNDVFGEIFRYLDQLEPGDEIVVYTSQHAYTYVVTGTEVVDPSRVELMDATPNATITLISCYPYLVDNKRIVVKGVLQAAGQ